MRRGVVWAYILRNAASLGTYCVLSRRMLHPRMATGIAVSGELVIHCRGHVSTIGGGHMGKSAPQTGHLVSATCPACWEAACMHLLMHLNEILAYL